MGIQLEAHRIARSNALAKALELSSLCVGAQAAPTADQVVADATKFFAFLTNTKTVESQLVGFANWFQDNRTRTLGKDFSTIVDEYLDEMGEA